jgi:ZIP family zinc transporter
MDLVIYTALGVGLATVVGAGIGFLFKNISHRLQDGILGFASGVMLAAAIISLILPSIELGGEYGIIVCVVGIFLGAIFLNLIDKLVPHLHKLSGNPLIEDGESKNKLNKILLFVFAIAIHNFPEGLAAGVSFGSDNIASFITVVGGITLQNIPEGMVIIAPMIAVGMSKKKTFLIALSTGIVEVIGVILGYFTISISNAILPFALSFAGGTMLYVISDEMIPETHAHGNERAATYALLFGFAVMLIFDFILG